MKPAALFLAGAVMLAAASTAVAQGPGEGTGRKLYTIPCTWKGDSELIVKRYRDCLNSGNQGVVEASLGHLVWIAIAAPCIDVTPLRADIERLSIEGSPAAIRLRAYLAAMVFENPEAFRTVAQRDFETPDDLFAGVTNQMYAAEEASLYSAVADSQ